MKNEDKTGNVYIHLFWIQQTQLKEHEVDLI